MNLSAARVTDLLNISNLLSFDGGSNQIYHEVSLLARLGELSLPKEGSR